MEYTKGEFEKQVKIGVEYAVECEMDEEQTIAHLTGHLWGTIGMVLQNAKQVDKREYHYNEPARVDDKSEIEGEEPHEEFGIGTSIFPDSKLNS